MPIKRAHRLSFSPKCARHKPKNLWAIEAVPGEFEIHAAMARTLRVWLQGLTIQREEAMAAQVRDAREAQYEYREGLRNVYEAIIENLSKNGVAINAEGVTYAFTWQPGAPVPSSVRFEIVPIGRHAMRVEFVNDEIEDCWEGMDRAEVRRKLREIVEKFTVVDRKQPELTDKQRFDEAVAVLKKNFPRLHQSLVSLWGTAQGESFLDGLIVDDRGGRRGFPPDTMRALLVLQRIHFQKFGTFKKVNPWDVV